MTNWAYEIDQTVVMVNEESQFENIKCTENANGGFTSFNAKLVNTDSVVLG